MNVNSSLRFLCICLAGLSLGFCTTPERRAALVEDPVKERIFTEAMITDPALYFADYPLIKVSTFQIEGGDLDQLERSLMTHGPRDRKNAPHYAETKWYIAWNMHRDADGKIECEKSQVTLDLSMMIPVWPGWRSASSPELKGCYRAMIEQLLKHEARHAQFAIEGAATVAAALKKRGCEKPDSTEQELSVLGHTLLEDVRERDRVYDRATGHGKREGITLACAASPAMN